MAMPSCITPVHRASSRAGSGRALPLDLRCPPRCAILARATSDARETHIVVHRRPLLLSLGAAVSAGWTGVHHAFAEPAVVDIGAPDQAKKLGRQVKTTPTGIKFSEVYTGHGQRVQSGDVVIIELVGRNEDGSTFMDTRAANQPLAFQIGKATKYVPEGVSQLVETMTEGDVRLASVPASLGYGESGASLPQGSVPPNARLLYEVELLRCQQFSMGIACCTESSFPCIGKDKLDKDGNPKLS